MNGENDGSKGSPWEGVAQALGVKADVERGG